MSKSKKPSKPKSKPSSKSKPSKAPTPPRKRKPKAPEQLVLIETEPENAKRIAAKARTFKSLCREQSQMTTQVKAARHDLLDEVRKSGVVADKNGAYTFHADGVKVTVTPRDEKIVVKEDGDDEGSDDGAEE